MKPVLKKVVAVNLNMNFMFQNCQLKYSKQPIVYPVYMCICVPSVYAIFWIHHEAIAVDNIKSNTLYISFQGDVK